ncbi:MAG: hypothetical protein JXA66_09355, partial [Oligoflexia bacterium]|nr:hypothetical protein [Oligoflexia bacterium]
PELALTLINDELSNGNSTVLNELFNDYQPEYPQLLKVRFSPRMKKINQLAGKKQAANKKILENAIYQLTGCNNAFIGLPVFYWGIYRDNNLSNSESHLPSPINSIYLNELIIMPDQRIQVFKNYIIKVIVEKLGISLHFIDDELFHAGKGDLHCSSNTFRTCRTQNQPE